MNNMVGKLGVSSIEKCAFCVRCHLWRDFMTIPKLSQNSSRLKLGETVRSEVAVQIELLVLRRSAQLAHENDEMFITHETKGCLSEFFAAMLCAFYH